MLNHILSFYLDVKLYHLTPLGLKVVTPSDFQLYLFTYDNDWYVISEEDYPSQADAIDDIENSLPVTVNGWHTLKSKSTSSPTLLPASCFSEAKDEEEEQRLFDELYHQEFGMKYALYSVTPDAGITRDDFIGTKRR